MSCQRKVAKRAERMDLIACWLRVEAGRGNNITTHLRPEREALTWYIDTVFKWA